MPLLVDTYNVLHTVGILPPHLAGMDVDHLMRLMQSSRYRDERATLVCDGAPEPRKQAPSAKFGAVTLRYSGKGKSADDLIAQLIRLSTAPRLLIVVSSDHEVLRQARKRRCRTMTSQEFLADLAADADAAGASTPSRPKKPSGGMTDAQIEKWVGIFDLDDQTMAIPSGERDPHSPSPDLASSRAEDAATPTPGEAPPSPHTIKNLKRREGLPSRLIEEAERMWAQNNPVKPDETAPEHR